MYSNLISKIKNFPEKPGVYLMKDTSGNILYIGKAGNLKRRVLSYFQKAKDLRIEKLLSEVKTIDYKITDSALEALILESNLIKKYNPKYNIKEKDDKSFLYILITSEKFPRILLIRGKDIKNARGEIFGPFIQSKNLRESLKIIRRIFPYNLHPENKIPQKKPCFDYQIGFCPGTCINQITQKEYNKIIKNIKLFLKGKKKQILKSLEKEMHLASKQLEFEKADKIKKQIFALNHIQDIALLNEDEIDLEKENKIQRIKRIEGYDISNISGKFATGSMVVFWNGKPQKSEYKKFKIKTVHQPNDVLMLKEVLKRRFLHKEWQFPDLILIDGGISQVNAAKQILNEFKLNIPIVGIAKGPKRNKNEFIGNLTLDFDKNILIKVRDEAHRFAISYHKKLRKIV
jgi:excinuclease ABC subunit C